MTACAANRRRKHSTSHRGNHIIQGVVANSFCFAYRDLRGVDARTKETRCHQRERLVGGELIARNLPANELIVRHIRIESADHKIAVVVGVWTIRVMFEAMAFREARHVQPMTCPAFAMVLIS